MKERSTGISCATRFLVFSNHVSPPIIGQNCFGTSSCPVINRVTERIRRPSPPARMIAARGDGLRVDKFMLIGPRVASNGGAIALTRKERKLGTF